MYALQSFQYNNTNFDLSASGLMTIDPISGVVTLISLSDDLQAPSAMAFGQGGFGSKILITELGVGPEATPTLLSVDDVGNVSTLISDLGADNPARIVFGPTGFGDFGNKLFVLAVGQFRGASVANNSGSILIVDDQTPETSAFLWDLDNPISLAFGDGAVLGRPGSTYLFVLEQGDLNPATGLPLGNGTLKAYDAEGNATLLVEDIYGASSLRTSQDARQLYFTAGNNVYNLHE